MADAQMTISQMTGESVTETSFLDRILPSNSGMRFNFDDIREFLNDPLIALIATDLTADENLDNIETILKRIRDEKQEQSSSVGEIMSGVHRVLFSNESDKKIEQQETLAEKISSKDMRSAHSIPNLCREVLRKEPQKPEPDLHFGKEFLWRMLLECFCTELLSYTIH